jgi:hypothetical protein
MAARPAGSNGSAVRVTVTPPPVRNVPETAVAITAVPEPASREFAPGEKEVEIVVFTWGPLLR